MERRIKTESLDPYRVDVLDGIRAVSILLVVWFHIWQQSWLMPIVELPFLKTFGLNPVVSFDCVPRGSFLFVDMLLLLSAFCLFLPHARATFLGEALPDTLYFYKKRLARIVPSYYFAVLVIFFAYALPSGAYANNGRWLLRDLLSTLTFTQTFLPDVLTATSLNGVLWTAAVEMQFYLIFPVLAFCFRKKPLVTYLAMVAVSMWYLQIFALGNPDTLRYTLNQLPGFFGVFANGMLASYGYVWLTTKVKRSAALSVPATAAVIFCLILVARMLKDATADSPVQIWQAAHRYVQSCVFTGLILSVALSAGWLRAVFTNRLMVFLSTISYNLYIWHQWLAVRLKAWRIPYWSGEQPPNFTGDKVWQWQYTLLCFGAALLVAALATYLVEKPAAKRLLHPNKRSERILP